MEDNDYYDSDEDNFFDRTGDGIGYLRTCSTKSVLTSSFAFINSGISPVPVCAYFVVVCEPCVLCI